MDWNVKPSFLMDCVEDDGNFINSIEVTCVRAAENKNNADSNIISDQLKKAEGDVLVPLLTYFVSSLVSSV